MAENQKIILGGPTAHLDDVLWVFHDKNFHGRSEGENVLVIPQVSSASLGIRWVVGRDAG